MTGPSRRRRGAFRRSAMLAAVGRTLRALATPLGRGQLAARLRGARLFQPATVTWADRHPALFDVVAAHLADRPAPRLLSFGCSTGEEAFTLAHRLPGARIDGIDANPACIARARRAAARSPDAARLRFACDDRPDALGGGPYDAALCLSVLRHGDLDARRPERCDGLLPFARFAAMVEALDRCVRVGGVLVLWGCHWRFADTAVAGRYRPVASPGARLQPGPFYGPDERLLPDASTAAFVFLKES